MAEPRVEEGAALPEVVTDTLGFKSLKGDNRARVCEAWPTADFPPPYSSLLSVASARALYAAGGPSGVSVLRTQDVRDAIYRSEGEDERECAPLVVIASPRPTHVAFASDESCLVIATEHSSEISAFSSATLCSKQVDKAVSISTNVPLRSLAPNPDPAQAQFFALINKSGQLLIADLGAGKLVQHNGSPVLLENASCVAWSNKGKQMIVGRADGTASQIKPDGTLVATLPCPNSLPEGCHADQITWIDNDVFYCAYSPSDGDADQTESHHYIITTDKSRSQFEFRKTGIDLAFAMVPRHPTHFFVQRLRNYKPALEEALIINNSVAPDTAMIVRSSQPLSETDPQPPDAFTTVDFLNEGLRASLPAPVDGNGDATATGSALDLSDKNSIHAPLSNDPDIAETSGPLPQLAVLSHEGVLKIWSVIYNASITSGQTYQGFAEIASMRETLAEQTAQQTVQEDVGSSSTSQMETAKPTNSFVTTTTGTASPFTQPTTTFGQPGGFGAGSAFQKTPLAGATSSWTSTGFGAGAQSPATTNDASSGQPLFGGTSMLGTSTAANKPVFGSSGFGGSVGQPTFGSTGFGQRPGAAPAFGTNGFGNNANTSSPFGGASANAASPFGQAVGATSSGFGAFANQSGFATQTDTKSESPFAAKSATNSTFGQTGPTGFGQATSSQSPFAARSTGKNAFGQEGSSGFGQAGQNKSSFFGQDTGNSSFGNAGSNTMFGAQKAENKGIFGDTTSFKIGSSFTKDETSSKDHDNDSESGFGFGGMGSMLGKKTQGSEKPVSKEEVMNEEVEDVETQPSPNRPAQETPPSTVGQTKTTPAPHIKSLFGSLEPATTTPAAQAKPESTTWSFGGLASTTPKDTPAPSNFLFGTKPVSEDRPSAADKDEPTTSFVFPAYKAERTSEKKEAASVSDPFSKTSQPAKDSHPSSAGFDLNQSKASTVQKTASSLTDVESNLPESVDDEGLQADSEGSGEDVTGDISPVEDEEEESDKSGSIEHIEKPVTSPESSFVGQSPEDSPAQSVFNSIPRPTGSKPPVPLFGEVQSKAPIFAPPAPKQQEEVRSPSPVRPVARATSRLSRSPERSFSAPAHGRNLLAQKKEQHAQSPFAVEAARARELEMAREQGRLEAARQAKAEAEKLELQPLEDDEEEALRNELEKEVEPAETLDPFMPGEPGKLLVDASSVRTDVPAQIERLYQDINSMIVTIGINARSLKAFMLHETSQGTQQDWPQVLSSETPNDALNEEWYLGDIPALQEGVTLVSEITTRLEMTDVVGKLEQCHQLLSGEVTELRTRLTQLRRSTAARSDIKSATNVSLSAEQSSIQQDLRKSSALVTSTLSQVEEDLVVLRAKLSEGTQAVDQNSVSSAEITFRTQRKPTVEAVINTVSKMTAMAEKKSADVDLLEAQLKKLGLQPDALVVAEPRTPSQKHHRSRADTPDSGKSVYLTPGSKTGTPASGRELMLSQEDRQRYTSKARRKRGVANALKQVLLDRMKEAAMPS